jgi:polysaccharide biosynthesis protein PslH
MRVAFFIDGTFIPERDGASTRFSRLPAAVARSGHGVCVFHAFRGWSQLDRIAREPYPTYFFKPATYYNDLSVLARLVAAEGIDIIQMNDLETVQNVGLPLAATTGTRLVYEAHYHSGTLASQLGLPFERQAEVRDLEVSVASSVDHIVTFSEQDLLRWILESNTHAERISIVPFGVDVTTPVNVNGWEGSPSIVFLGNGYFEPNRRAIKRIADTIWPALSRRRGDATCMIIGAMPTDLRDACLKVGVSLAGEVPDPGMHLRGCGVGIAPIFEGSGIRVKLLHYLGSGIPAIATSCAAEGLPFAAIRIEDRIECYADVIEGLLSDVEEVRRMVFESQCLLNRRYTWEHVAAVAVKTYEGVLNRPTRNRPPAGVRAGRMPLWLEEALQSGRFDGCDDFATVQFSYGVAGDGRIKLY